MAEKQITIRISATDNFSSVINKYQQAMGQAATDTEQFNKATGSSAGGVDNLTNAIGDAVKGFIAFKAIGMVSELVQLGGAANATRATFNALSGGAAEATNTLNQMRAATGGIVADTELMAGANRLLAMHIANTGQQAADLAGVAVNLGRAFGQDAASAIENFSLMIANQSLLRLDSLGISASNVRARMAELKDEFPEMDKQARFTQATLEEATKTVDRLGTSITAAQTPIAKLETRFENFKTNVGTTLADILNNAITTFDQLGVVMSHGWDEFTAQHPGAGNDAGSTFWAANQTKFENDRYAAVRNQMAQQAALARAQAYVAENFGTVSSEPGKVFGGDIGRGGNASTLSAFADYNFGARSGIADQGYANDKLYQFQSNTADMGKFLDPAVFDDIKARFEELQRLNEQGLISDESLTKAEEFKNQAEAAANAFKNMSLTDIFGQTSGGMKGQIGDMVIAQMKKSGASDEAIAAAQQNFDLASGRETQASVAMKNTVAPMIANLTPDQQAQAIENMNAFLEAAAKLNLSPDQIAAGIGGATGFVGSGTGQSFSISPGQTPGEVARDLKISVDQLLAIVGAPNARSVQPGTYSLGTGYQAVPGFNPATYAAGFANPQGANAATGAVNATNPFVTAGFATQGVIDAGQQGQNAGADPADKMKDMEDSSGGLLDNMSKVADQVDEMTQKADSFNNTLDLASASREMTFTVNVKDNTKGLLELLIGANRIATLGFEAGAGGGGTRDNGGRVGGVDGRVGQRPGITT